MKITESQLRRIIREETKRLIESPGSAQDPRKAEIIERWTTDADNESEWYRVSADFYVMSDPQDREGADLRNQYYKGLSPQDFQEMLSAINAYWGIED